MKTLYLIGGTMGVGKTSVCGQLQKMLPNSVFLDGDWCWDARPFVVTDETKAMVMDNIRHVLNNFLRCTAYNHVLFAWVMHQQTIIDDILKGIDTNGCVVHTISLTADEPALRARFLRDIQSGLRTAQDLARSVAHLPLYESLATIRIDTTVKGVAETAREILRVTGGQT